MTVEWWSKMMFPVQKVWFRVAKRLGIRKTGLVKLRHDVRTCQYEDVHVLWEMLKRNESGPARPAAAGKRGNFWNVISWAGRAPFLCRGV